MKAEIEAKIAELEQQLQAERDKLVTFVAQVPVEYHSLTRELFDRIKTFFE